jgi:N-acetylglutamate synthase-like GNAT family acetyltransferase
MNQTYLPAHFTLRPATLADASTIRNIISQVRINPMALDWHRFVLAVDAYGMVIGCGQVKPHSDGSIELASIAVLPDWRSKGVARRIIEYLLEQHPGRIYLTCQSELGPMYQKFGFQVIQRAEMTPYFRRLSQIINWIGKLTRLPRTLLVMRRN